MRQISPQGDSSLPQVLDVRWPVFQEHPRFRQKLFLTLWKSKAFHPKAFSYEQLKQMCGQNSVSVKKDHDTKQEAVNNKEQKPLWSSWIKSNQKTILQFKMIRKLN